MPEIHRFAEGRRTSPKVPLAGKEVRGIFFDMGGTLVSSIGRSELEALRAVLEELGLKFETSKVEKAYVLAEASFRDRALAHGFFNLPS